MVHVYMTIKTPMTTMTPLTPRSRAALLGCSCASPEGSVPVWSGAGTTVVLVTMATPPVASVVVKTTSVVMERVVRRVVDRVSAEVEGVVSGAVAEVSMMRIGRV